MVSDTVPHADAGRFHLKERLGYRPGDGVNHILRDSNRAFAKLLGRKIGTEELTMGTWYFLRVLWEKDGISQRELSRRIGMMEPTTVTAVTMMERDGLAKRRRDPNDRRRRLVYLAERGQALKDVALPFAHEVELIATSGLSEEELDLLWVLLGKLKKNLDSAIANEG